MSKLVINSELFLGCSGSCSGCFLSEEERASSNFYLDVIRPQVLKILDSNYSKFSEIIIGFGRGNHLVLPRKQLEEISSFVSYINSTYKDSCITFEISTSLVGKIDSQIENAIYLISQNKNIFFNVVINSEITSNNFWLNWSKFNIATSKYRSNSGVLTDNGDILVLNINPNHLPNIKFLEKYISGIKSPLNIALFPFDNPIYQSDLEKLNKWTSAFYKKFNTYDLNIKNFLNSLNDLSDYSMIDIKESIVNNSRNFYFINKNGAIENGHYSVMGEIDIDRVYKKYNFDSNNQIKNFINITSRNKSCISCDHIKTCLQTGSYINALINSKKIKDNTTYCLTGYRPIFELFASNLK